MEYLIIIVLLIAALGFFLYKKNRPGQPADTPAVEATYICDQCGEHECICRKEENGQSK
ncbi:MAG: hypothetical protein KFF46_04920 [Desulfobacterales bacterium]|nr:hypothetical protein [Desulfobacterales bacterium]